ncbi:MAG: hypothetical protein WCS99_05260 [Limisphaerales bacterium]
MKASTLGLLAILCGASIKTVVGAEPVRNPNRVAFSGKFSFLIGADFTSSTPPPAIGAPGASGGTIPSTAVDRFYDDGFVRIDISGNAAGTTWFWGYNDASQVAGAGTPGATLTFHSAPSPADQFTRGSRDEVLPGFELSYGRVLKEWEIRPGRIASFGLMGSFGYTDLRLRDSGVAAGTVLLTTDTYLIGPGVLPPAPPFSGTFAGPGGVIPDNPNGGRVTAPAAATASVVNRVEGRMYAVTLGPFFEVPFHERLLAKFSGGLAVAIADRTYTFSETVAVVGAPVMSRSGTVSSADLLAGASFQMGLAWAITESWSLDVGGQYQYLGTTRQSVLGKTARLDLQSAVSLLASVNFRF